MYISTWLERATAQIRFGPDRASVRLELLDHLEDRRDAFRAQGMDYPEAEQAATAAMGDPEEIAAELGLLHSPWWGYLWTLSRWALRVTVGLFAFLLLTGQLGSLILVPADGSPPSLPEAEVRYNVHTAHLKDSWEPTGKAKLGIFNFTVPLVYLQEEVWDDPEQPNTYLLSVYLEPRTWRFWEAFSAYSPRTIFGTSTDSDGVVYPFDGRGYDWPEGPKLRNFLSYRDGRTSGYILEFWIPGPDAPDWLDITVGYGDEFIHLDLKNEEVR